MQWFGRRESSNVEDRRGMSGGGIAAGGGILGLIIYVVYSFLGGNVDSSQLPQIGTQTEQRELFFNKKKADDERVSFVRNASDL